MVPPSPSDRSPTLIVERGGPESTEGEIGDDAVGAQHAAPLLDVSRREHPSEHVLVLRVSNRQPFPSIAHHELEARDPGSDREKRDRAVRILARRDIAPPLAEVEDGAPALTAHIDVAQGVIMEVPG